MQTETPQGGMGSLVTRLTGHSIVTRVLVLASLSLVVLTATTVIVAQSTASGALIAEVSQGRANVVKQIQQRLLDRGAPSIIDGKLYFGSWAIESEPAYLDSIADATGLAGTVFQLQGDRFVRVSTAVKNPDGTRNLGTEATPDISRQILLGANFDAPATVAGVIRSGYYVPIKDAQGKVVAALVAGAPVTVVDQVTREILVSVARVAVPVLALAVLLLWLSLRPVRRGLRELTLAANALAAGDVEQAPSVHSRDELGEVAEAFRRMIAYQRAMADVADAMADSDLTTDVTPKSERDHLGTSFKRMIANLRDLVSQVQESAVSLADTSAQLGSAAAQTGSAVQQVTMAVQNVASGAQETSRSAQETTAAVTQLSQVIDGIARGATDQARQVQTTSATASQMANGIEEVAVNATQMATAGQQTRTAAEHGGQAVRETTAAMIEIQVVVGQAASKVRELGTLGQKIGAVVETIDDIAEQTNLLALNAAIEAARAGEHGKGFAVVADEVRKLAERSGRETKQIAELIAQVQTGTKEAVGAMDSGAAKVEFGSEKAAQAGQALEEILKAVQDTVRQVGEIASSSQQMASGARSVTDAMQSISAVVERSSAATEQMAAQASAVTGSIQSIAAVSQEQSAATEQVSASTEQMSAQVEEMSAQAQELADTAQQLKQLVARFKLDEQATHAAARPRQPAAKTAAPLRHAA
jgi:methyl-accepting chemotaxis protein